MTNSEEKVKSTFVGLITINKLAVKAFTVEQQMEMGS